MRIGKHPRQIAASFGFDKKGREEDHHPHSLHSITTLRILLYLPAHITNIITVALETMKELGYNTISRVMETWETARRVAKNFEDELGTHMLTK